MNIYLGNLSIKEIEKRTGINFPKELIEFMEGRNQAEASNIKPNRWHCFDIPFNLVCGDMETAQRIYDYLAPMSREFKERLQISINK